MDIILIAGLWLRQSAWDPVVDELDGSGHNAIALSLPGVDDELTEATLEDQVAAAVAAVDIADRPLVVGHSAACTIAWMVADQRPTNVRGVALIGGFPSSDGDTYADFFEPVDGLMPFPGWEPFEGPDSDDLDEQTRERLVADMVAVPEGVSRSIVRLTDERRFDVPVNLVWPLRSRSGRFRLLSVVAMTSEPTIPARGANVFLIGPLVSGKTAVGKQLARLLHLQFHDSDAEIEHRTGVDIPFIFEMEGVAGFREREREVIDSLTSMHDVIIATGGGAVLLPENREHLANRGRVVYLQTGIEQQLERTRHGRQRPLLYTDNPEQMLRDLMAFRAPLYESIAVVVVPTDGRQVRAVAEEVVQRLQELSTP
jgi:shikimate kinase